MRRTDTAGSKRPFAIWITGLPASGKSMLTAALQRQLAMRGVEAAVLESDALRKILTPHPCFDEQERATFYRQMTYIGTLLNAHGVPVIFDATANRRAYRMEARSQLPQLIEVYVDTPLEICAARDPKGLYGKARAGELHSLPGVQAEYEPPLNPEITVHGNGGGAEGAARRILRELSERGYL